MKYLFIILISYVLFPSCILSQEYNLANVRQLTFGGDNAEAYFSPDGQKLTMQISNPEKNIACDQIYMLDLATDHLEPQQVSTGKGRTTCSFFMPDGKHILYASTHESSEACPPAPKSPNGQYVWAIYPSYDIYMADLKGKIKKKMTDQEGYDAEAVVSPDGKKIAFTSMRSGDLELWIMDIDGKNLHQLTFDLGYDGGSFFSPDSKKLVFRASRPKTETEINNYKSLLSQNLVAPTEMEIFTINIDGTDLKQVTQLGKANWAPYFHPKGEKIIFSSNHHATKGYDFQLFMVDINGENLQQITWQSQFNAFPMFSPDGKKLVFSSNRNQSKPRETNVFIADWIEQDPSEMVNISALKKHISILASDQYEGRLTGSQGEKMAAQYLSQQFQLLPVKPLLPSATFEQTFTYQLSKNPHAVAQQTDEQITGINIVAFLDNNATQTMVIGAHYDHLGRNEHHNSTLPNSDGQVHNGADDNASGVSAVLELSRILSTNKKQESVNFIFALFSGEEDGLMGSKALADYLKQKNINIKSMINLDMVGRLNTDKNLVVGGVGTSPSFAEWLEKNKPAGFNLTFENTGIGPSDHTSFYLKDIPVLFFFTGTHEDYHKPTDDADRIQYMGVKQITEYVFRMTQVIGDVPNLTFTKSADTSAKKAPKYKVTLGIMPDYTDYGDGLHVEGVMEGRPAALAGIESEDVIVKIGDCAIKEVYSYMECLSQLQAGDEKEVVILRNGERLVKKVQF